MYFPRTRCRGSKYTMLEPVQLPLMEVVDEVVLQHVPPGGRGGADWHVQHVEVTWWVKRLRCRPCIGC